MDYSGKDIIWLQAEKKRLLEEFDEMFGARISLISDEIREVNTAISKRQKERKEFEHNKVLRELNIKR